MEMTQQITNSITNKSEVIHEISTALAKAQGALEGAKKDSVNPHFKSGYASLDSTWDACRKALSDNGLSVVQIPSAKGATVAVTTILCHSSGQFFEGTLEMVAQKNTPQGVGSAITYARRYALMAFVGISPEDDDGNEASKERPRQAIPRPEMTQPMLKRLFALQNSSTWTTETLKEILSEKYGVSSTRDLSVQQYNEVCAALEANKRPPKTVEDLKADGQIKPGTEL